MQKEPMTEETHKTILDLERGELTEYHIYRMLSARIKDPHNRGVLAEMADQEYRHYEIWKGYTEEDVEPDTLRIWFYYLLSRIFGVTFGIKLMESREDEAVQTYGRLAEVIPEARGILEEEVEHEKKTAGMLDERALRYVGSVVLGLNDALVEFTGTLAGLTFAFQDTRLIAMAGIITGIAASLSMGASEFLSQKTEQTENNPLTASVYTTGAYVATVAVLVSPFLILDRPLMALPLTLFGAILVILFFTFYTSVAQSIPFWRRFGEMAAISLGIAGISFLIGMAVRMALGVDI